MYLAGPRFRIRPATLDDVKDLTDVFFHSFNAPFWQYFIPDTPYMRQWWDDAWTMGIENPTDRTFVVEDTEKDNKVVGFSRWMVPQQDGNQERKWPDMSETDWDMEIVENFFGGMEANRHELMGTKPHWMLEMLGVHEDYQRQGIAASLIKWGTDQGGSAAAIGRSTYQADYCEADRDSLETYLDGSSKGQPYYKGRHSFGLREKDIPIPDRPAAYGSYSYKSLVRPPQQVV